VRCYYLSILSNKHNYFYLIFRIRKAIIEVVLTLSFCFWHLLLFIFILRNIEVNGYTTSAKWYVLFRILQGNGSCSPSRWYKLLSHLIFILCLLSAVCFLFLSFLSIYNSIQFTIDGKREEHQHHWPVLGSNLGLNCWHNRILKFIIIYI